MTDESNSQEGHNLVPVHACANDSEAAVVVSFLSAHDIEAFESSNLPHSIYPVVEDGQILVHESNAEEAFRLLRERENNIDDTGASADEDV